MSIEVRAATVFDDVATLVGPKNPASNVCFCLSYRIGSKENVALRGQARAERVRELCEHDPAPASSLISTMSPSAGRLCIRDAIRASPAAGSSRWSMISTCGRRGAFACGPGIASTARASVWGRRPCA
jgi:hypothetical protein